MPQSIKTDLKQWIFNENAQYSGAGEKHLISAEDNVWGRCIGMGRQLVQPVPGNRRGDHSEHQLLGHQHGEQF